MMASMAKYEIDPRAIRSEIDSRRGGKTYLEVAKEIGVTETTLSRIMNGHNSPSLEFVIAFMAWRGAGFNIHCLLTERPSS